MNPKGKTLVVYNVVLRLVSLNRRRIDQCCFEDGPELKQNKGPDWSSIHIQNMGEPVKPGMTLKKLLTELERVLFLYLFTNGLLSFQLYYYVF